MTREEMLALCDAIGNFNTIPRSSMTEDILEVGLNLLKQRPEGISLFEQTTYYDAAYETIKQSSLLIARIHPEFIDPAMASLVPPSHIQFLKSKLGERFHDIVGQAQVDKCIEFDINNALLFAGQYVKDEVLKHFIQANPKRTCEQLVQLGRTHILKDLIAEGFWPHPESRVPRPVEGLAETIKVRMKINSDEPNHQMWLNAVIKTHPVDEVVPLLKTPARLKLLLDLYDRSEIIHLIKDSKQAKGMFLCQELGL